LIDIFIPTLNSIDTIQECIQAIHRTVPVKRIIVVDGGSTDGTLEYCKRNTDLTLTQKIPGIGAARQLGLEQIETTLYGSFDSDVTDIPHNWYKKLEPLFDSPRTAMASAVTIFGKDNLLEKYHIQRAIKEKRGCISLCNALIRTDAIKQIGGYRPLPAAEDVDIKQRLRENGYKVTQPLDLILYHERTLLDDLKSMTWYSSGSAALGYPIHKGLTRFLKGIPIAVGYSSIFIGLPFYLILRNLVWSLSFINHCRRQRT